MILIVIEWRFDTPDKKSIQLRAIDWPPSRPYAHFTRTEKIGGRLPSRIRHNCPLPGNTRGAHVGESQRSAFSRTETAGRATYQMRLDSPEEVKKSGIKSISSAFKSERT